MWKDSAVLLNLSMPGLPTARGKNKHMSGLFVLFKNDRKSKIYPMDVSAAAAQAYWLVRFMNLQFGSWEKSPAKLFNCPTPIWTYRPEGAGEYL